MTSFFKLVGNGHDQHDNIDNHTREYVESMETGNGKEVVGEIG